LGKKCYSCMRIQRWEGCCGRWRGKEIGSILRKGDQQAKRTDRLMHSNAALRKSGWVSVWEAEGRDNAARTNDDSRRSHSGKGQPGGTPKKPGVRRVRNGRIYRRRNPKGDRGVPLLGSNRPRRRERRRRGRVNAKTCTTVDLVVSYPEAGGGVMGCKDPGQREGSSDRGPYSEPTWRSRWQKKKAGKKIGKSRIVEPDGAHL